MKHFWTWKKVTLFLGIIGLGILGLVIADRHDFLQGRSSDDSITIGNGVADPLVQGDIPKVIQDKAKATTKASVSESSSSGIDGVKCGKKC